MNALRRLAGFARRDRSSADMRTLPPDTLGLQRSPDCRYVPVGKSGSRLDARFPGMEALERGGAGEILLCMTSYNEGSHALLVSLYSHARNMLTYREAGLGDKVREITLCILSDGRKPMARNLALLAEQLGMYDPGRLDPEADMHVFETFLSSHQIAYALQLSSGLNLMQEYWHRVYKDARRSGYRRQADDLLAKTDIKFKVLFCVKDRNAGKLDTHWWFFEAFCRHYNPKYCLQMDIGTAPQRDCVLRFWRAMESNPRIGAIGSRVRTIPPARFWHFMEGWQFMDFAAGTLGSWMLEILTGYLSVVPGPFGIYRWQALAGDDGDPDNPTPLRRYYRGLGRITPFEAAMYRAEDRILCYEITHRTGYTWKVHYDPDAAATTDACNTLPELMHQRRRWYGSYVACRFWVLSKIMTFLRDPGKSPASKLHMLVSFVYNSGILLLDWFIPASILLIFAGLYVNAAAVAGEGSPTAAILDAWFAALVALFGIQTALSLRGRLTPAVARFLLWNAGAQTLFLVACVGVLVLNIFSWGQSNLLLLGMFGLIILTLPAISWIYSGRLFLTIFRLIVQFLFLQPAMSMILWLYALSNIHDTSWGTKGLVHEEPADNGNGGRVFGLSENQRFRLLFVGGWYGANAALVALVCVKGWLSGFQVLTALVCVNGVKNGLGIVANFLLSPLKSFRILQDDIKNTDNFGRSS